MSIRGTLLFALLVQGAPLSVPAGPVQGPGAGAGPSLQTGAAPTSASAQTDALELEPWTETPEAAVRELRRLSLDGDHEEAMALGARALLAAHAEANDWDELRRAEVDYAVGLVLLRGGEALHQDVRAAAEPLFDTAAAFAGPGPLRLDALYDAALVHLHEAERQRRSIPEVQAALASGATGVMPGGVGSPGGLAPSPTLGGPGAMPQFGGDPDAEAPDPLELARGAYLTSRDRFLLRLRADWRNADTRANLELIERRLAELDEIERLREEQQEEQQQGDDSAPSEDGEQQESEEPPPEGDEPPESEPEDESETPPEPEEQQPPDPSEEQPEPEEQEPPPPSEEETEQEEPDSSGQEAEPNEAPPEERHLTREEVVRLLDRLKELEDQARDLERAIQRQRRTPVERDW